MYQLVAAPSREAPIMEPMLSQDLLAACPFLPDWIASKALLPTKTCSRSLGVVQRVARTKRGRETELGRRDEKKRLDCKRGGRITGSIGVRRSDCIPTIRRLTLT